MDSAPKVAAIILAAGASKRMAGESKLVRSLGGRTILERVLENAQASGVLPVVVVSPDSAPESTRDLPGYRFVVNPVASEGMGTSIACGVQASPHGSSGYMIWPGDMPLINFGTVRLLVERGAEGADSQIVVPVLEGRRGHPVLFGSDYRSALSRLSGDAGARRIVEGASDCVVEVEVGDLGIFMDVDTEDDLDAARRFLERAGYAEER